MLKISQTFTELLDLATVTVEGPCLFASENGQRYLAPASSVIVPTRSALDAVAEAEGERLGLMFQPGEASGAYFMMNGDTPLVREKWYALVETANVLDGVRAVVVAIHEKFGPGKAWTLGGRVHVITDDGGIVCSDVDGVRHVWLRTFVCHERNARRTT